MRKKKVCLKSLERNVKVDRLEFLESIFNLFGKKDEQMLRAYDLALSVNKTVDWYKLYKIIIKDYTRLPSPSDILAKLEFCLIRINTEDYGKIVVFITENNKIFNFVCTGYGNEFSRNLERLKEQYGKVLVKIFPPNTTILKNEALIPDYDGFTVEILSFPEELRKAA